MGLRDEPEGAKASDPPALESDLFDDWEDDDWEDESDTDGDDVGQRETEGSSKGSLYY